MGVFLLIVFFLLTAPFWIVVGLIKLIQHVVREGW